MKKNTRITLLMLLIITAVTFIPLFTVILLQRTKIDPNRTYLTTHTRKRGYYGLAVTEEYFYEFSIN